MKPWLHAPYPPSTLRPLVSLSVSRLVHTYLFSSQFTHAKPGHKCGFCQAECEYIFDWYGSQSSYLVVYVVRTLWCTKLLQVLYRLQRMTQGGPLIWLAYTECLSVLQTREMQVRPWLCERKAISYNPSRSSQDINTVFIVQPCVTLELSQSGFLTDW